MKKFLKNVLKKRKKILTLTFFFFLSLAIPLTAFFVTTDRNFDERGMASEDTTSSTKCVIISPTTIMSYPHGTFKCGKNLPTKILQPKHLFVCDNGTWKDHIWCDGSSSALITTHCENDNTTYREGYCVDGSGYTCWLSNNKYKLNETACSLNKTALFTCGRDGIFATQTCPTGQVCENKYNRNQCTAPIVEKKYKRTSDVCRASGKYSCEEDSSGSYPSLSACEDKCDPLTPPPTTKYKRTSEVCGSNGKFSCKEDPSGPYSSLSACEDKCDPPAPPPPPPPPPPTTKYKRTSEECGSNGKYDCTESSSGEYTSLSDCQSKCDPPTPPPPTSDPKCGSHHEKTFSENETSWPTGKFCAEGEPDPSSPVFPDFGRTTTWECKLGSKNAACWAKRAEEGTPGEGCNVNADCRREAPYEICFEKKCLRGDVNNDGRIDASDFGEFKKDFVVFKQSGWGESLRRSDFNMDSSLSMADYSIFVKSYRLVNKID